jgi:uncharacterized OB-fold protein
MSDAPITLQDCLKEIEHALNHWYPIRMEAGKEERDARHKRLFGFRWKLEAQLRRIEALETTTLENTAQWRTHNQGVIVKILTEMDSANVLVIASKEEWDAYKALMIAIDHMLNFPVIDAAHQHAEPEAPKVTRNVALKPAGNKPATDADKREKKRLSNIAYREKRKAPATPTQQCASCGVAVSIRRKYCEKCAKLADAESKRQSHLRKRQVETPAPAAAMAQAKRCPVCGEKFASPGAYCSVCLANRKVDVLVHMADNRKAGKP